MLLKVTDLNVSYGDAQALWNISLHLDKGEIVTVVGPNGAGKTTLLNTLAGIVPARSGHIMLNGHDLTTVPSHQISHHGIAIAPEGRRLFAEMSVRENLDVGSYVPEARRYHSKTLERVYSLFPILKERRRQTAGTLSGGEQQMLSISRALMARPSLLLLDEPSLGLAPLFVDHIFEALQEINQTGVSILIVEQNVVKVFELATRGYILEIGRIVQEGKSEDIVNDPHIQEAYLGLG